MVRKHWASRLQYDFRLELDRVMLSWAVPKGRAMTRREEDEGPCRDHPLSYDTFEGPIPAKQYGAGTVIVWDNGTWEPVGDPREGMPHGEPNALIRKCRNPAFADVTLNPDSSGLPAARLSWRAGP